MKNKNFIKKVCCYYLFLLMTTGTINSIQFFNSDSAYANDLIPLSTGQVLYVPAYSHIYSGDREFPILLTVTLSIRNVDSNHPITVSYADYYGTNGELIKRYAEKSVTLKPLESIRYIIPQKDRSGGSGANFMVEWKSEKSVNQPIIESVMIGTEGQQGISFTSRGQVITTSN